MTDDSNKREPLKVVCYGASLTEGLTYRYGRCEPEFTPFAEMLGPQTRGKIEGRSEGISGQVSREVLARFNSDLKKPFVQTADVLLFFGCEPNHEQSK